MSDFIRKGVDLELPGRTDPKPEFESRFYLKEGDTAEVMLLIPSIQDVDRFYEHNLFIPDRQLRQEIGPVRVACTNFATDDLSPTTCPICSEQMFLGNFITRDLIHGLWIADMRKSVYKGKEWQHKKKYLAMKKEATTAFVKEVKSRDVQRLFGAVFEISRIGSNAAASGNQFRFKGYVSNQYLETSHRVRDLVEYYAKQGRQITIQDAVREYFGTLPDSKKYFSPTAKRIKFFMSALRRAFPRSNPQGNMNTYESHTSELTYSSDIPVGQSYNNTPEVSYQENTQVESPFGNGDSPGFGFSSAELSSPSSQPNQVAPSSYNQNPVSTQKTLSPVSGIQYPTPEANYAPHPVGQQNPLPKRASSPPSNSVQSYAPENNVPISTMELNTPISAGSQPPAVKQNTPLSHTAAEVRPVEGFVTEPPVQKRKSPTKKAKKTQNVPPTEVFQGAVDSELMQEVEAASPEGEITPADFDSFLPKQQ